MKEILQEYQRPKVERSANEAKRHGDECWWVFDDFREFHWVVLWCVLLLMSRSFLQTF